MKVSHNQGSIANWIQWMVNGTDTNTVIGVAAIGLASAAMYAYMNAPALSACSSLNQTALAIWPPRIASAIDTEGKKWTAFNTAAIAAYRKPDLNLEGLSNLFSKD